MRKSLNVLSNRSLRALAALMSDLAIERWSGWTDASPGFANPLPNRGLQSDPLELEKFHLSRAGVSPCWTFAHILPLKDGSYKTLYKDFFRRPHRR